MEAPGPQTVALTISRSPFHFLPCFPSPLLVSDFGFGEGRLRHTALGGNILNGNVKYQDTSSLWFKAAASPECCSHLTNVHMPTWTKLSVQCQERCRGMRLRPQEALEESWEVGKLGLGGD